MLVVTVDMFTTVSTFAVVTITTAVQVVGRVKHDIVAVAQRLENSLLSHVVGPPISSTGECAARNEIIKSCVADEMAFAGLVRRGGTRDARLGSNERFGQMSAIRI